MINESYIDKVIRLTKLNQRLLNTLTKILKEIIIYVRENNISIPYNLQPLLEETQELINEIKHKTVIEKPCSMCGKLNPEDATFCAYCGTTIDVIVSPPPDYDRDKKPPEDVTKCKFL